MRENSFIPMYQQIKEGIKSSIDKGVYKPKEKIPSEPELSQEYGASRITVRRAVEELCNEGYLVKMQGKGTFVSVPRMHRKYTGAVNSIKSFTEACREEGMVAGARVLECQIVPAQKEEAEFLGLEPNALLLHIQRIRTMDDMPVLLENHFFPYEEFRELMSEELQDKSIFEIVKNKFGREFSDTKYRTLEIVRASAEVAHKMSVPLNEPLFYMNVFFMDHDRKPLCIGRQYYHGSRYMLVW